MKKKIPGVLLCCLLAVLSILISKIHASLSATTVAILFGCLLGNLFKVPKIFETGIKFSEKNFLSLGTMLLGLGLKIEMVQTLGWKPIQILCLVIPGTILLTYLFSQLLGGSKTFGFFTGVGNAICGNSAIAACANLVRPHQKSDLILSISAVNIIGLLAMLVLPMIATLFQWDTFKASYVIGGSLQAVSQAVAAGYAINPEVGMLTTTIKLARVSFLVPLIIGVSLFQKDRMTKNPFKILPPYLYGFILCIVSVQMGWLPKSLAHIGSQVSDFFLVISLGALGVGIHINTILRDGPKALLICLLGSIGSILLILSLI